LNSLVARPHAICIESREELNDTDLPPFSVPLPPFWREIVDDDQRIGSTTGARGATKKAPSLALALVPRPELFPTADSWQAPDCNGREEDAWIDVDPSKELPGEK
jgi:hypothetical protein